MHNLLEFIVVLIPTFLGSKGCFDILYINGITKLKKTKFKKKECVSQDLCSFIV